MDLSNLADESDIDDYLTPIETSRNHSHGQIIESDSVSELFFLEKDKPRPLYGSKARSKGATSGTQKHKKDLTKLKSPTSSSRHRRRVPSDESDVPYEDEDHMKEIYKELQLISDKLKKENQVLHEREERVKERERLLVISQSNIKTITEHQVKQKLQEIEQKYQEEMNQLDHSLREKAKENKRLKDNFETLKQANDALRKEMDILQQGYEKLEKQAVSSQSRLVNLQRKHEFEQRQKGDKPMPVLDSSVAKLSKVKESDEGSKKCSKSIKNVSSPVLETMSVLLDWVCDAHLRQTLTEQPTQPSERLTQPEYVQEKIVRVLPSLVELLKENNLVNLRVSLPCLQFIYWSLIHIDKSQPTPKANMTSTLRRLGEEVYRPRFNKLSDSTNQEPPIPGDYRAEKRQDGLFFRSQNSHLRFLSSLIILKTLTQADQLAIVFDTLKVDLKSDVIKELFLYYQATAVISSYLKPINKVFLGPAVDILIQMSTDSPFASSFLESCSNEAWFRTIAMVLRTPVQEHRIMDCLSILLQKLSKIKSNRRYFEVYTITSILQEILRNCGNENAFLSLNLKSILFNLNCTAK
ncbi:hypothetical protein SNE40_016474 [Patella caerulea]|uniref:Coiled-coil domain-containing protein 138 n=1 Tax=Patella caerulea TaxID=87958 RepID=A0AAN8J8N9_PATCE